MPDHQETIQTPVLFLIFNRPNTTARVFEAIRKARPARLYVAADGPREEYEGEARLVEEVRRIATAVDWHCDMKTLFRDQNLGCKQAVSSAISWFFEHEEQGIILEDDCLPHPDFFSFCESLLDLYAGDPRVAVVTGNNFQNGQKRGNASYYFSKYNHCWGWGSWRRAWQNYQGELPFWPEWSESSEWRKLTPDPAERRYWGKIFNRVKRGEIDSWAYPWTASVWFQNGLTATPNVNLVSNIGFGLDSTHTASANSPLANLPTQALGRIRPADHVEQNIKADRYVFENNFGGKWMRFPLVLVTYVLGFLSFVRRTLIKE